MHQGNVSQVMHDPLAQELLNSNIPARLAGLVMGAPGFTQFSYGRRGFAPTLEASGRSASKLRPSPDQKGMRILLHIHMPPRDTDGLLVIEMMGGTLALRPDEDLIEELA
jgi:hypothetical protein